MKPDYIIDFRDSIAPISLLKVSQLFMKMTFQDVMEIRGFDPDARQDLFRVLPNASYDIISTEMQTDAETGACSRLLLKKRKPSGGGIE